MNRPHASIVAFAVLTLYSCIAHAVTTPPTQLTILHGAGPASYVTLNWTAPPGTSALKIYRTSSLPVVLSPANLLTTLLGMPPSSTYQDPLGATPPYYYAVTANDGSGESSLSNEVGYVAIEALGGGGYSTVSTMFGVPFVTWDAPAGVAQYGVYADSVKDVIIDQAVCGTAAIGDRIVATIGGANCYYRCSPPPQSWQGTLTRLNPARVFYYDKRSFHPTATVIIAGEVDNSSSHYSSTIPIPAPVSGQPSAPTWFSWPDARILPMNQLELFSSGINTGTSPSSADLILSLGPVDAGAFAYCDPSGVWGGTLTQVVPGQAYMIVNQGPNTWNYTYSYSLTN